MDEEGSYDISICSGDGGDESLDVPLRAAVNAALCRHAIAHAVLEIDIVDDATIAALNERYLSHEGPTDVLTFDLNREQRGIPSGNGPVAPAVAADGGDGSARSVEGQIVVSYETARREAAARGHSASAELSLYVVHGVLHLLGYDDHEDLDARRMHEMEDALLKEAGLGAVFVRPERL